MTAETDIQKIYIAYFNRPADNSGLSYWTGQISSGKSTLADLTSAFSGTAEYRDLYGASSASAVVEKVYQNLFGRAPEAAGLQYWTQQLESGKIGIGTVAYSALNAAAGTDKTTIDNKAAAAALFSQQLAATGKDATYVGSMLAEVKNWLGAIGALDASLAVARLTVGSMIDHPLPGTDAKTYAFKIGYDKTLPTGPDFNWNADHLSGFRLGTDKIHLNAVNGSNVVPGSTAFYLADPASSSLSAADFTKNAIFEALAFAHSGSRSFNPNPLLKGESVLIAFDDHGQLKTYLFIDDGTSNDPGGLNGPGSVAWNLDADKVIDLTGIVGLQLSSDHLTVAGSLFA